MQIGVDLLVPGECYGMTWTDELLLMATWPLVLIALRLASALVWEVLGHLTSHDRYVSVTPRPPVWEVLRLLTSRGHHMTVT